MKIFISMFVVTLFSPFGLAMEETSVDLDREAEKLARWYILQSTQFKSDHIKNRWDPDLTHMQQDYLAKHLDEQYVVDVPSEDGGRLIPTVVIKSKAVQKHDKTYPLIIHLHGGNGVFSEDKFDVILHYLASKGFVVLAPNFYGSTGCVGSRKLVETQKCSNGERLKKAIGDIVDVTAWALHEEASINAYVDPNKIILSAFSDGSKIANGLLVDIGNKKTRKLFKAVHFQSAAWLDAKSQPWAIDRIPKDISLFIAHGQKDTVFSANYAVTAMETLIQNHPQTKVHLLKYGTHHFMDYRLDPENLDNSGNKHLFEDLKNYMKAMLEFYYSIQHGTKAQQSKYAEFEKIVSIKGTTRTLESPSSHRRVAKFIGDRIMHHKSINRGALSSAHHPRERGNVEGLAASVAYLKLILGDEFDLDNDDHNIKSFFDKHFMNAKEQKNKKGETVLEDQVFLQMVKNAFKKEKESHEENPQQIFAYHMADGRTIAVYLFATMWRSFLLGLPVHDQVRFLRVFEDPFYRHQDIQSLLNETDQKSHDTTIYNNRPGFGDCAISANYSIFGNHRNALSNTLLWLFLDKTFGDNLDTTRMVQKFLSQIYNEKDEADTIKLRLFAYLDLFESYAKKNGGGLLQLSFSQKDADQFGFLSQAYGERIALGFNDEKPTYQPSSFLRQFKRDPLATETSLASQKDQFTNPSRRKLFGREAPHFHYAEELQLRMMVPFQVMMRSQVHAYTRDQAQFDDLSTRLLELIAHDFEQLLLSNRSMSRAIHQTIPSTTRIFDTIVSYVEKRPIVRQIPESEIVRLIQQRDIEGMKRYFEIQNNSVNKPIWISKNEEKTPLEIASEAIAKRNLNTHDYNNEFPRWAYEPNEKDRAVFKYLLSLGARILPSFDRDILYKLSTIVFGNETYRKEVICNLLKEGYVNAAIDYTQLSQSKFESPFIPLEQCISFEPKFDAARIGTILQRAIEVFGKERLSTKFNGESLVNNLLIPSRNNQEIFKWLINNGYADDLVSDSNIDEDLELAAKQHERFKELLEILKAYRKEHPRKEQQSPDVEYV